MGDLLTLGTGLNRGRIRWNEMKIIEVPKYDNIINNLSGSVKLMFDLWDAQEKFNIGLEKQAIDIDNTFSLNDESAKERWLSYKPPE